MFAGLGSSYNEVKLSIDGISTSYLGGWGGSLHLYLENMNLTELPAGVFDGLEHRNRDLFLFLQGNKLRTLPEGLFRNLRSLGELHLQGNKLRTLPEGLFRNLRSLRKLQLQGNCLRSLPEGLFQNLSSIRRLYLQNNGLEELPSSVCAKPCWFDIFFNWQWMTSLPLLLNWQVFLGNEQKWKNPAMLLMTESLRQLMGIVSYEFLWFISFFTSHVVQDFSSTVCSNFIWLLSPHALRTLCRSQKAAVPWPEKPQLQLTPCGHVRWTWFFL